MTDRPILMSAPMVRALLREIEQPGSGKTQTRRLAWQMKYTDQPEWQSGMTEPKPTIWQSVKPGDRLWVRETWGEVHSTSSPAGNPIDGYVLYRETDLEPEGWRSETFRWCRSIHMPRWASRLTLLVTATKMERVQMISNEDCWAEGIEPRAVRRRSKYDDTPHPLRQDFEGLWQSLHTKPGARWEDNPEVVAITFRPVLENIDQVAA